MGDKVTRRLITIPDKFLQQVDKVADAQSMSRSELIRQAIREYVEIKEMIR